MEKRAKKKNKTERISMRTTPQIKKSLETLAAISQKPFSNVIDELIQNGYVTHIPFGKEIARQLWEISENTKQMDCSQTIRVNNSISEMIVNQINIIKLMSRGNM